MTFLLPSLFPIAGDWNGEGQVVHVAEKCHKIHSSEVVLILLETSSYLPQLILYAWDI